MGFIIWLIMFLVTSTTMLAASCVYRAEEREVMGEPVPQPPEVARAKPPYIPPALRVEEAGPTPSTTHVWIPGHWDWNGYDWVWTAGKWELPPSSSSVWVSGHWKWDGVNWVWVPGHWE
ncbi:MAG TPA: hypothetical protein VNN20_12655 [Thermodesulfobacteriota bacterium]|nr:hypothetical protein [Thermodesulfobacteriota bacterium]